MSTRNPQNKRSQEKLQGGLSGMARRSTSSAKPARPAAGSVRVVASSAKAKRTQMERGEDLSNLSKEEKRARRAEIRRREDLVYDGSDAIMHENPAYQKLRRVWLILIVAGVATLAATWIALATLGKDNAQYNVIQMVLIGFAYVFILAAFILDFVKIRPIRNAARSEAEGMSETKLKTLVERRRANRKK